jgi:hypothetical protein
MSQSSTALTGSCVDQHQDIVAYFRSWGLGGGMQAQAYTHVGLGEWQRACTYSKAGSHRSGIDTHGKDMSTFRLCCSCEQSC